LHYFCAMNGNPAMGENKYPCRVTKITELLAEEHNLCG
jgi:hypothetical protein